MGAARRLAEDGHVLRVAAECGDVLPYPVERTDEVERGEVPRALGFRRAFTAQRGVAEISERSEPVVHREHDHTLGAGEVAPIVEAAVTDGVPATVDPHHDGQASLARRDTPLGKARGPHVPVET